MSSDQPQYGPPGQPYPPQQPPYQQAPQYGPAPGYGPPPGHPVQPYPAAGYGPAPMSPADERQWAMFSHLSALLLGFLGPLIIWSTYKERGPFVRRQSAEALNFQLFFLIVWLVSIVVTVVIAIVTMGAGLFLLFPILMIEWVLNIVFIVLAGIAANRGEDYRYPVNIRFVSGS